MKHSVQFNSQLPSAHIRLTNVSKRYPGTAGGELALKSLSLQINAGGLTAIVGKSGSGKSTLLNLLTGVDQPTTGEIFVGESVVHSLDETTSARWRCTNVGIVFQFFQLLPALTVFENVLLPMALRGGSTPTAQAQRVQALLTQVGIAEHAHKLPAALSGGQQQRCAIARALANEPPLLVADEPTGNLDSRTAVGVLSLLRRLADSGRTVLLVTHERDIGLIADRVITLSDGHVASDESGLSRQPELTGGASA